MSIIYNGTITEEIIDRAKREMTREELQFMEDKWREIMQNQYVLRTYSGTFNLTDALNRDILVAEKAFYLGYIVSRCKKTEETKLGQTLK